METTTEAQQPQQIQTTATVAQPQTAASELGVVKDLAGGSGAVTIVLTLLLLVGGTAGWKFWNNFSKQKHEQKMKQMELEAELKKAELEKAKQESADKFKRKVKQVKAKKGK